MKLSEELKKAIIKEIEEQLPKFPEGVDVSDTKSDVTGVCIKLADWLFIDIEEEEC